MLKLRWEHQQQPVWHVQLVRATWELLKWWFGEMLERYFKNCFAVMHVDFQLQYFIWVNAALNRAELGKSDKWFHANKLNSL